MCNKKLSNNGFSLPLIILLATVFLSILVTLYYFFYYNKNISVNNSAENNTKNQVSPIDCSKDGDIDSCESLKWLNNARKERGLSEITKDETLCKLAKDISASVIKGDNSKEVFVLQTYLDNLLNDKKYDYISRNKDRSTIQVDGFKAGTQYKDTWDFRFNRGLERFDKGCIVYSELNNSGGFWRVVLFLDSGTGN
jgi:hypothetical protein